MIRLPEPFRARPNCHANVSCRLFALVRPRRRVDHSENVSSNPPRENIMIRLLIATAIFLSPAFVAPIAKAEDKDAWKRAALKRLEGRWRTVQEIQLDKDRFERRRLDLEFSDGKLRVFAHDREGNAAWDKALKLTEIEYGRSVRYRLTHELGELCYDEVGRRIIIVGRVAPRPWEGFPLSGVYERVKAK